MGIWLFLYILDGAPTQWESNLLYMVYQSSLLTITPYEVAIILIYL